MQGHDFKLRLREIFFKKKFSFVLEKNQFPLPQGAGSRVEEVSNITPAVWTWFTVYFKKQKVLRVYTNFPYPSRKQKNQACGVQYNWQASTSHQKTNVLKLAIQSYVTQSLQTKEKKRWRAWHGVEWVLGEFENPTESFKKGLASCQNLKIPGGFIIQKKKSFGDIKIRPRGI